MTCKHMNFSAQVNVQRIEDIAAFNAEITINCADCGLSFDFVGAPIGCVDHYKPITNLLGDELRVPIVPHGETQKSGLTGVSLTVTQFELPQ